MGASPHSCPVSVSPGCLINQELRFGTCQYGRVCGRTGHMRCGQALRLDQWSKSHYQVMTACRAWAKGAVCHWLRPPCSHTRPSPLTSQVSKRTAWILFDLFADPTRGEILGPHQWGVVEKLVLELLKVNHTEGSKHRDGDWTSTQIYNMQSFSARHQFHLKVRGPSVLLQ